MAMILYYGELILKEGSLSKEKIGFCSSRILNDLMQSGAYIKALLREVIFSAFRNATALRDRSRT